MVPSMGEVGLRGANIEIQEVDRPRTKYLKRRRRGLQEVDIEVDMRRSGHVQMYNRSYDARGGEISHLPITHIAR